MHILLAVYIAVPYNFEWMFNSVGRMYRTCGISVVDSRLLTELHIQVNRVPSATKPEQQQQHKLHLQLPIDQYTYCNQITKCTNFFYLIYIILLSFGTIDIRQSVDYYQTSKRQLNDKHTFDCMRRTKSPSLFVDSIFYKLFIELSICISKTQQ